MLNTFKQPTPGGTFLPEDYVRAQGERRATIMAVMLFAVVMGCVVTAFVTTTQRWASVRDRQRQVQEAYESQARELKKLEELERQRLELADKGAITTALVERVPRSLLLAEVVANLPPQITLTKVELDGERVKEKAGSGDSRGSGVRSISSSKNSPRAKKGAKEEPAKPKIAPPKFTFSVKLEGLSTHNSAITDYMSLLKGSPLLSGIDLVSIDQVAVEGRDLRKFTITAVLEQDLDETAIALVRERCGLSAHASAPEISLPADDGFDAPAPTTPTSPDDPGQE